uniref:Ig-like domain-containing protein n=1 Tax=Anolis carolinensis TaxID=28377 RepID=A0A803TBM1_ANOCA
MPPSLWAILIALAASSSSVHSQVVLTQSGGALKKPGESHEMICGTSGFTLSSTWMNWVRQKLGQGLEWLVDYYGTSSGQSYYSSAIQGRFTASKSGSNFYLHMNNLKIEDTAVYYCARGTVRETSPDSRQKLSHAFIQKNIMSPGSKEDSQPVNSYRSARKKDIME